MLAGRVDRLVTEGIGDRIQVMPVVEQQRCERRPPCVRRYAITVLPVLLDAFDRVEDVFDCLVVAIATGHIAIA